MRAKRTRSEVPLIARSNEEEPAALVSGIVGPTRGAAAPPREECGGLLALVGSARQGRIGSATRSSAYMSGNTEPPFWFKNSVTSVQFAGTVNVPESCTHVPDGPVTCPRNGKLSTPLQCVFTERTNGRSEPEFWSAQIDAEYLPAPVVNENAGPMKLAVRPLFRPEKLPECAKAELCASAPPKVNQPLVPLSKPGLPEKFVTLLALTTRSST